MCDLTAASYRHGAIIEAKAENGEAKPLTVSQARQVGIEIRRRLPEYMHAASMRIHDSIRNLGGGLKFLDPEIDSGLNKAISSRFDPGLILDLPKILVRSSGRAIEFRTCMTVCVGLTKSKVWTRANTIGDWGKISDDELNQLHKLFDAACRAINSDLINKYQQDFSHAIESRVNLSQYGGIHVFAADCAGTGISDALEQLCDILRKKPSDTRTIDNPELASALRSVTKVAAVDEAGDATNGVEFALSERAKFYPHRGSNGAGSVFVRYAENQDAYFSGIVNGSHVERTEGQEVIYGNSTGTTAEIAAFFGAAF